MVFQKYNKEDIKNINKIGIIMFGLLGDVLLRTPVIRALKQLYPKANITAIVDPIGKMVLEYNNNVDNIILIEKNKQNKFKHNINKINGILNIRKEKFDLIVNLYNGGSSPTLVFLSKAKYKLGFCQQKNNFIYNIKNNCHEDRLHQAQTLNNYMISIIEPLSKDKFSLKPDFSIPSEISNNIKIYLANFNINTNKIYTLNLGSGDEDKILNNDKYFQLVNYIYITYKFIPAIISNPGQEYFQTNFIDDYMKSSEVPYIKLKNLNITEVAAIIDQTKFLITPDTGLMHLGMAFNNPIYTVFTYTHPIFVDPKNDKFISVYKYFDEDVFYQHQNISQELLNNKIDLLFSSL